MRTGRTAQEELRLIEGLLADVALDKALLRLRRGTLHRKDWTTQPRAPAGQSDGGQWIADAGGGQNVPPTSWASSRSGEPDGGVKPSSTTESTTLEDGTRILSIRVHAGRKAFDEQHAVIAPDGESRIFETSGATQTIRDGDTGEVLSRTTFTTTELVSEPIVQSAFAPFVPFAIEAGIEAIQAARTIELALSLLTVLSARKDGFGTVLGLTAHEYTPGDQSSAKLTAWVGQLSQQQLDSACPRNGEVRAITNDVTRTVRASGQYRNRTEFGNKVHRGIANVVKDREDPNFRAEILLDPAGKEARATGEGNVRLDLLENVASTETLCIYDYKTGKADLSMNRALRLASIASKNFGNHKRIIVIQMRPEL